MSEKIVQLNEEVIKELVRSSVEETRNGLLEEESKKLTQAALSLSSLTLPYLVVGLTAACAC
jgi:hypothetical protein